MKLPLYVPRADENHPLLDLIPWAKRADRLIPSAVEPPVGEESLDWLDEPIEISVVPNWHRGSPATRDPQRWCFAQARVLMRNLVRHVERNDKYAIGITPGLFEHGELTAEDSETRCYAPGEPRRAATGDNAQIVLLEFDGVGARWVHEVHAALKSYQLAHTIYSTFSESAKSEIGFDTRCRLALFPDRRLRTNEYTPTWMWWNLWLGNIADQAPKSIASVSYTPSHPTTEEARRTAWATGLLGYRFDADAIVGAMQSWIRARSRKGERRLVGDLSNAGWISEGMEVLTKDGLMLPLGQLDDGTRFHAPDRPDETASCTVWVDDEGVKRATDWSTARHWRVGDSDVAELKAWVAGARASHEAEALADALPVSQATKCGGKCTVLDLAVHVATQPPGVSPARLPPVPDLLPSLGLQAIGVREIVTTSAAGMAEALREQARPGTTVILQAQPGVGKTQAAVELALGVGSVVIVNPLRKLARRNAARFGVPYYEDVTPRTSGVVSVSTTIHSRHLMPITPWLRIVDELSAVLRQIHGETCHGKHVRAYRDLLDDLGNGTCVVTGADITLEEIEMVVGHVRRHAPDRDFVVIKCTAPGLDRDACCGTQREIETHLFDLLAAQDVARTAAPAVLGVAKLGAARLGPAPEAPPAIYGCADTVEEVEALAEETRRRFPGMPVGVLHGDSDDAPLDDIDAWVEAHRGGVVFLTHAAAEGISINVPVSHVVGIRKYSMVSAQTFAQLLCRPRVVLNKTVWIGQPRWNDGTHTTDAKVIRERILAGALQDEALRDHFWPGRRDAPVDCPEYLDARVLHERMVALALNHPQAELAVARYGWPSQQVAAPGVALVDLEPARESIREARDERVLAAPDLDDIDASALRRRGRRTPEQRAALERKAIRDFYGDVTPGIVKYDRRGRQRERLRLFAHARLVQRGGGRLVAVADYRARGGEAHPACERHVLARAALLGQLWEALSGPVGARVGAGAPAGALVGQDAAISSADLLSRGRAFVREHREDLHAARLKVPSERGLAKWLLSRLRDGGAIVRLQRSGQARAHEVTWPEDWTVAHYETMLQDAEQCEALRAALRAAG